MEIRITTLAENTASMRCVGEWGLSVLVEVNGLHILVDTGPGFSLVYNAGLLGVDLSAVDGVILSHGHYDHTGGLRDLLRRRQAELEIVAHPDIWAPKYAQRKRERLRYVGIPFCRAELEGLGARFVFSREPVYLAEEILTTGEIPMVTSYESIDSGLLAETDQGLVDDPLADDAALVIKSKEGLVVILGCAHRGLINTLYHAREITGEERVYCVLGGTHLFGAPFERVHQTIADLKKLQVQKIGVSHCTGFVASAALARELGDAFFLNNAGTRLTLPAK